MCRDVVAVTHGGLSEVVASLKSFTVRVPLAGFRLPNLSEDRIAHRV